MNRSPNQERLRDSFWLGLHRILNVNAVLLPVSQQVLESRSVLRRRNEEDVANSRQHQRAERVIDHGLVVNRQQAFAGRLGYRVQPCARPAGQNDAFVRLTQ